MNARVFKPVLFMAVLVLFVSVACLGGTSTPQAPAVTQVVLVVTPTADQAAPTPQPAATQEPVVTEAPTSAPVESGAVASLEDLEKAVINIVVEGTYVDPYEGWQVNVGSGGSGFIIDPSGIAVTNNHVVTGAAQVKVFLTGESQPRNARVLGVSECSDLAVIDIDGDGFPYVDWFEGDIKTSLRVYAAGYPGSLTGRNYTLTEGIVSTSSASWDSYWAAVDDVIKHTARINPGNSGGPLVDSNAKVLGVNYGGYSVTDEQYAISRNIAKSIIDQLREDKNVDSIGVNGVAVSGDLDGNLVTGIWVRSVDGGSPADKARIMAGDIIIELGGQVMEFEDFGDYCSVLRAHNPTDTLNVTIIRSSTLEVLEGQLNGRELAYVSTLGSSGGQTGGSVVADPTGYSSGDIFWDDEFDTDLSDWFYFLTSGEDSGFSAETTDSRLRLEFDDTYTYSYFIYDPLIIEDVRIDTKAENLGRNNNNVSLICRYSDRGWYEFNIANSGLYYIYRYDPNTSDKYIELARGGSTEIRMGQDVNEYTAICDGDQLTLGINGTEVRTIRDRSLTEGQVGISVSSFNVTPIIVELDYFTLSLP